MSLLGFIESSRYFYSEVIVPRQLEYADSFDVKDDCYYSGYVEDSPDSRVVLSTCAGLWGHVQIGSFKYEIESIENSSTFQHLIYRREPEQREPCRGVLVEEADLKSGNEELKMVDNDSLIPSERSFLAENRNESRLVLVMLLMMADVHSIYFEIGLRVYLVGLELWTERDYVMVDSANLGAYGNLAFDAETVAHELGHSLGFSHDDTPGNKARGCDCNCTSPGKCMMASGYITCQRLSNCSRQVYYDTIRKPGKECLLNLPTKVFRQKICGNGILEDNEECDCGLHEECLRNGCCQKDCRLKPNIDCLHGLCCKNCKFSEVGATCREAASECDLPEYCNGTSADCPLDIYKQDGMPCGTKNNCYAGKCLNLHQHCTDLFGKDAKPAPLLCFMEVNIQGDQSGNCGQQGLKYKKCKEEDVLCGRVQCINVKNIPKMSTGQAIVQTPVERTWCWGTELHLGKDVCDLGAVKDGTACGSDKICINRSCVGVDVLNYDCDFKKCNNRGVCNSNRNCHCVYGWAPPFCEAKGYGGSIDSGPPPPYMMPVGLIVGIVTVVGLFLLMLAFVATLKREKLQAWESVEAQRFPGLLHLPISPDSPPTWDAGGTPVGMAAAAAASQRPQAEECRQDTP
ncbi:disintegrin and metalloproteinase domain-containing protein 9-like [Tiliqua scincoides]|uniref:disintegrin and metalloproteinase domain-containing protein 9-like n=1 Tax=Tiliqua scincoides TaxID=71010 RepID=UPI003462F6A5